MKSRWQSRGTGLWWVWLLNWNSWLIADGGDFDNWLIINLKLQVNSELVRWRWWCGGGELWMWYVDCDWVIVRWEQRGREEMERRGELRFECAVVINGDAGSELVAWMQKTIDRV
jgi:hypothetical protein